MTFWQSYGGIFTGLGILGTIETLKNGIAKLLSGVESAFVTSLVGIFCALIYSGIHHLLMKNFQENVKSLTEKLDEIFPRRSAEDWLAKNFDEAQIQTATLQTVDTDINEQTATLQTVDTDINKQTAVLQTVDTDINKQTAVLQNIGTDVSNQTTTLQNIGEQVAEAIFDGIDARIEEAVDKLCNKLEERLIPQTDKICTAIDKLGTGAAEGLNDTISKVAGAQMDRFSAALDKFSNDIDEKFKNADEISKAFKDCSEIVGNHNSATKETFDRVQKLLGETESYLELMNEASTTLKQAAEPVRQSTLQLTKNLTETSAQMNNLANANQTTRQNLFALTERLSNFVKDFNGIAGELERSTEIISGSLETYNYKMSDGLSDALTKFDKSMNDSVGHLKELVEDLSDALNDFNQKRR